MKFNKQKYKDKAENYLLKITKFETFTLAKGVFSIMAIYVC
jgi:hypothetical protein